MDHALSTVSDLVGRRPVIVLNAIDFFENNLIKEYLQYISSRRPKVLMVGMETDSHLPLGYFKLTDGRVSGVIEKPARGSEPSSVVKMTFDYFDDPQEFVSLFDAISHPQGADMRYELALDILLKRYGADMIYTNSWSKLIYPHSVLDVTHALLTRELQEHIEPTAHVSPLASLNGPVYVDHDARIDAFAVIKGPTYIGRGVTIGSHTLIRQSMIEHGATVGYGSEVARSYVGPDCQLHHSFVGDSVLEREVNMSWGTVTTNLRFDRRSVRCKLPDGKVIPTDKVKLGAMIAQGAFLGANVTTMPGVCIGANSNILPGSLIR